MLPKYRYRSDINGSFDCDFKLLECWLVLDHRTLCWRYTYGTNAGYLRRFWREFAQLCQQCLDSRISSVLYHVSLKHLGEVFKRYQQSGLIYLYRKSGALPMSECYAWSFMYSGDKLTLKILYKSLDAVNKATFGSLRTKWEKHVLEVHRKRTMFF